MKDRNNFDNEELARWYADAHVCFWCELFQKDQAKWNWGNCFHHILGRRGKYNNSLLNSFFINNELCHLPRHPSLKKKKNQILLLKKTLEWLMFRGYQLKEVDENFILAHYELYEGVLIQRKNEEKNEKENNG